jgi:hypothetical protein
VAQFYVDTPSWFFHKDADSLEALQSLYGPQHGDPFGPLLFALAIHDAITRVQHDHPSVVLLTYLDDIHLLGAPKDVRRSSDCAPEAAIFARTRTFCRGL